jgi:hypothetical protein
MKTPEMLYLAWRNPDSRRILPIARLLKHNGEYEFACINAVKQATHLGFQPLLSFPDLDGVYITSELPPLFTNRVMPKSRPDFPECVSELGIHIELETQDAH